MQRWRSTRHEYLWSVDVHLCSILTSALQVSGSFTPLSAAVELRYTLENGLVDDGSLEAL